MRFSIGRVIELLEHHNFIFPFFDLKIIIINHPSQGSQGSKYFSGKPESIFTNKMWQNAGGISPENVSNTMYNTIDRLVVFFFVIHFSF